MIKLKNIIKALTYVLEEYEIKMDIICGGGHGNKKRIKIPSSGHLRYDPFK